MTSDILEHKFISIPKTAFIASVIFHGLILLMAVSTADLKWADIPFLSTHPIKQEMYQSFIQVDVVSLPDQMLKDMLPVDTSAPVVDKQQKAKEPDAKQSATEQNMTIPDAKLKEAETKKRAEELVAKKKAEEKKLLADQDKALKQRAEEAKREQAMKALADQKGKAGRKELKGNKQSQGNAVTGNIGEIRDKWVAQVYQAIKNNFNVFLWHNRKKELTVSISLQLFPTGRIRERKVLLKSSDATFDSAALQAVDQAQPYPLPEDPSVLNEAIVITLKPEELK